MSCMFSLYVSVHSCKMQILLVFNKLSCQIQNIAARNNSIFFRIGYCIVGKKKKKRKREIGKKKSKSKQKIPSVSFETNKQ